MGFFDYFKGEGEKVGRLVVPVPESVRKKRITRPTKPQISTKRYIVFKRKKYKYKPIKRRIKDSLKTMTAPKIIDFSRKEATKIDTAIKRFSVKHVPTLTEIQRAGYDYGRRNPKQARLIVGGGNVGAGIIKKSIPKEIGVPVAQATHAFAQGALTGVKREPVKAIGFMAVPPAFKAVSAVARASKVGLLLHKVPKGQLISKTALKGLTYGMGVLYTVESHKKITAPVLVGYKSGKPTETRKTLPDGSIKITTKTEQIPITRAPTKNEQIERFGSIFSTELAPMGISHQILSKGIKLGRYKKPDIEKKIRTEAKTISAKEAIKAEKIEAARLKKIKKPDIEEKIRKEARAAEAKEAAKMEKAELELEKARLKYEKKVSRRKKITKVTKKVSEVKETFGTKVKKIGLLRTKIKNKINVISKLGRKKRLLEKKPIYLMEVKKNTKLKDLIAKQERLMNEYITTSKRYRLSAEVKETLRLRKIKETKIEKERIAQKKAMDEQKKKSDEFYGLLKKQEQLLKDAIKIMEGISVPKVKPKAKPKVKPVVKPKRVKTESEMKAALARSKVKYLIEHPKKMEIKPKVKPTTKPIAKPKAISKRVKKDIGMFCTRNKCKKIIEVEEYNLKPLLEPSPTLKQVAKPYAYAEPVRLDIAKFIKLEVAPAPKPKTVRAIQTQVQTQTQTLTKLKVKTKVLTKQKTLIKTKLVQMAKTRVKLKTLLLTTTELSLKRKIAYEIKYLTAQITETNTIAKIIEKEKIKTDAIIDTITKPTPTPTPKPTPTPTPIPTISITPVKQIEKIIALKQITSVIPTPPPIILPKKVVKPKKKKRKYVRKTIAWEVKNPIPTLHKLFK